MTLSYDEAGQGPAIVLLHSGVCDRRMWDPQMPALAEAGYRVIRCDFRGFGESPAPHGPYSDAQDVVDLLDALGADQAAVIASSFGGKVGLEVAARWPDRVNRLALLCTALEGHERSPQLQAFGEQEHTLLEAGDVEAAIDLNVRSWVGPDADESVRDKVRLMQRRAFEVQMAMAEEDYEPIEAETDLAAIKAPSLVVSGAHDFTDFEQIAARLVRELPQARHVHLPWAGHLPSMERPDEITSLLLGFLSQTAA